MEAGYAAFGIQYLDPADDRPRNPPVWPLHSLTILGQKRLYFQIPDMMTATCMYETHVALAAQEVPVRTPPVGYLLRCERFEGTLESFPSGHLPPFGTFTLGPLAGIRMLAARGLPV